MFNSFEIRNILLELGLKLDTDNKRIKGYITNNDKKLYLKTSSDPENKPVNKAPLLIHPALHEHNDKINQILDLSVDWTDYFHNSNLKGFPLRERNGKKPIEYGFAVDVKSKAALRKLLSLIDPLSFNIGSNPLDEITEAESSLPSDETSRKSIIDARIGQGKFREDLISHWSSCAVTGAGNTLLLKASHIKPWKDSNNTERLDHFNGLLLSANLDAAFDSGLISFNDSGAIMVSEFFEDSADFGISTSLKLRDIHDKHKPYLQHHRNSVFKGTP